MWDKGLNSFTGPYEVIATCCPQTYCPPNQTYQEGRCMSHLFPFSLTHSHCLLGLLHHTVQKTLEHFWPIHRAGGVCTPGLGVSCEQSWNNCGESFVNHELCIAFGFFPKGILFLLSLFLFFLSWFIDYFLYCWPQYSSGCETQDLGNSNIRQEKHPSIFIS